jgi:glycosyltransferase involved in cell wall biosynthesis
MNFSNSIFSQNKKISIPENSRIIFVADMFAEDYVGGAELTTEALIDASPYNVFKLHSKDVTQELLEAGLDRFWIFGNYVSVDPRLLSIISDNLLYGLLEYDYKFCKYRSPDKHAFSENVACDCAVTLHGKMIADFMLKAKKIWWMSEAQKNMYLTAFPTLSNSSNVVLSSVFSKHHLDRMSNLAYAHRKLNRKGWIVLGSNSWIKGAPEAKQWCIDNNKSYELVWQLPYDQVLSKLASAEGFVYLPSGGDTCPRMVIEAKLLGCELVTNEHVQHAQENWFANGTPETISEYLQNSPVTFWDGVKSIIDKKITISGYTQTRNCIEQDYPWKESIESMLGFCDEVVVVDGGSTDETYNELLAWAQAEPKLKPFQCIRDWNDKRFALFNGAQKAVARDKCTSDFLWQVDIDEVVHENDYDKIRMMASTFPKNVDILALPVIEYWGSEQKVRVDVNPWKWRLTRNNPRITHGVPIEQRKFDAAGTMFSAGSDGDDYIYRDTGERVPFASFYTAQVDQARHAAMAGNQEALFGYEKWFEAVSSTVPGVHHYSWYDLERKVYTYKNFWSKHWASLYNVEQADTAHNNKFFDKPWSEVTDEEIKTISQRMKDEMGGWIFHNRIDFSKPTPSVKLTRAQPAVMKNWLSKRDK